jgi:hypothetical protein
VDTLRTKVELPPAGGRASHGVVPASGYAVCCGVSSPRSDAGARWPDKFVCIRAYRPAAAIFHAAGKTVLDHCVCVPLETTHQDLVLSLHQAGITSERAESVVGGPPAAKANQIGRA